MAHLAAKGRRQRCEVLILALATGDHHQRARHAGDRGERGADVGPLGVVDVGDAVHVGHPLRAVRQPGECGQLRQHRWLRERERLAQRERRERVGGVVKPPDLHGRHRHEGRAGACQPPFALVHGHRVVGADGGAQREAQGARGRARHGHHQRIIEIDHRGVAAGENTRLGGGIARHARVAVEVIGADVQDRRGAAVQCGRGLELKARQLQHVQLGALGEQIERRLAQVAAGAHAHPGALRHARHERGDGALAVGAGDADHRCIDRAREQLDVAHDREPAAARLGKERLGERHPGGRDHAHRALEEGRIEPAGAHRNPRIERAQGGKLRGGRARIGHREAPAAQPQMPRARQPGAA